MKITYYYYLSIIGLYHHLPLFNKHNTIDGVSLDERTVPECRWSDNPEIDSWMWRDYMVSMGFGYPLGVDLPGEKRGMIDQNRILVIRGDLTFGGIDIKS